MAKKHKQPKTQSPSAPKTASSSSPTEKFQCPLCPCTYTRITDVNVHVNKKHREEARALNWETCPECDTLCPTARYLKHHIAVAHSVGRKVKKAQKLNISGKADSEGNSTAEEVESQRVKENSCQSSDNKMDTGSYSREVKPNRSKAENFEAVKEASLKVVPKVISIRKKKHSLPEAKSDKRSDKRHLALKSFSPDNVLIKSNQSILLKQSQDNSFCLNSSDSDVQTSTPSSTGPLKLSFRWDREQSNWTINKSNNTAREDKDSKICLSFDGEENDVEKQIETLQKQSETLKTQIEELNSSINKGKGSGRKSGHGLTRNNQTPLENYNETKENEMSEDSNYENVSTTTADSDEDEEEVNMCYNLDPAFILSFGEEDCEEVDEDGSDDEDEQETGESRQVEEISLLTDDEEEEIAMSQNSSKKRISSVVLASIPKKNRPDRTFVATNVTFERRASRPSFARLTLERNQSFKTKASHNNNRKYRKEVIEVARYQPSKPQTSIVPFDIGTTEILKMRNTSSSSLKSQKPDTTKAFKTKKQSKEGNSREFFGLGPRESMVIVEENYELAENNFPFVGPYMCEICRTFVKTNIEFVRHVQENHRNELDEDVLKIMQSQLTI